MRSAAYEMRMTLLLGRHHTREAAWIIHCAVPAMHEIQRGMIRGAWIVSDLVLGVREKLKNKKQIELNFAWIP